MKKKKRGIIFISNVTKAMEHEWFADHVDRQELDLRFILFNSKDSALYHYLRKKGFVTRNYQLKNNAQIPFYILYFFFALVARRPHFTHAHLFQAGVIASVAAWMAGIRKRIYTRHHADVHLTYFPHAVKYDKLINRLSTHLIAVSGMVAGIMAQREQANPKKIYIIPHGLPESVLRQKADAQQVEQMRERYGLSGRQPVIGIISRLVDWKGIRYMIPACISILQEFPNAKLVLANASGPLEQEVDDELKRVASDSYTKIRFEDDVLNLISCFDIFVHTPVEKTAEAFGQVYIEVMSRGIPMVCTLSGVAIELVRDGENALVANFQDGESIYRNIHKLLSDQELANRLGRQAQQDVMTYTFEEKFRKITEVYLK